MNAEDKELVLKTIFEMLKADSQGDDSNDRSEDDKLFRTNTTKEITNRDSQYTELLKHFVSITILRNRLKEFFKWTFYLVIIISIIVLVVITYRLFNRILSISEVEKIMEAIPLLITTMVGFVSTIITIPVTITKYLFSTKEDQNITQIILHTQDHDTSGRQWAMDFKNIADNFKNKSDESEQTSVL